MLISLLILGLAAVLLFASDRLAQARLQRPRGAPPAPSRPAVARRENEGGRVLRAPTDFRRTPSVRPSLHTSAGIYAVKDMASHL